MIFLSGLCTLGLETIVGSSALYRVDSQWCCFLVHKVNISMKATKYNEISKTFLMLNTKQFQITLWDFAKLKWPSHNMNCFFGILSKKYLGHISIFGTIAICKKSEIIKKYFCYVYSKSCYKIVSLIFLIFCSLVPKIEICLNTFRTTISKIVISNR